MKILVDTHAYLWWLQDSEELSATARSVFEDRDCQMNWSAASTWEMAIKLALGKLRLPQGKTLRDFSSLLAEDALSILPVQHSHAVEIATLPPHHRDPFDRMLVAQARSEGLTLLTADSAMSLYEVKTIW